MSGFILQYCLSANFRGCKYLRAVNKFHLIFVFASLDISSIDAHDDMCIVYNICVFDFVRQNFCRKCVENYSYTPSGDQPMGEQEMKIRGVH